MSSASPVALVTGAGRGLGRAICESFHQAGYTVVATDYDPALLADLNGRDGYLTAALDVTDSDAATAVATLIGEQLGRLDVVINNAGIIDYCPVSEADPERTIRAFQVNTFGSLRVTHACLDLLCESRGRVICITSESYRLCVPFQSYQPSKLALEGLADVLRRELSLLGIHVATVRPGAIRTELFNAMHHISNPVANSRLARPFDSMAKKLHEKPPTRVSEPAEVAQVVLRAATDPRKRAHYEINNMLVMKIARLLPKRWVDKAVNKLVS